MHIIRIVCENHRILILLIYFTYLLTYFNYFRSSSSRARKKVVTSFWRHEFDNNRQDCLRDEPPILHLVKIDFLVFFAPQRRHVVSIKLQFIMEEPSVQGVSFLRFLVTSRWRIIGELLRWAYLSVCVSVCLFASILPEPHARPTSMPSFILIYPTIWPQ